MIDPYLIKLDKMDKLDLPPNQIKVRLKKRIADLQISIKDMADAKLQRQAHREQRAKRQEEKAKR